MLQPDFGKILLVHHPNVHNFRTGQWTQKKTILNMCYTVLMRYF